MSIDARIETIIRNEDGSGQLRLVDRPRLRPGDTPGIAGQSVLRFDAAPRDVTDLQGQDIWGGDSQIMLGDTKIARREGYTKIRFVVVDFREAIQSLEPQAVERL